MSLLTHYQDIYNTAHCEGYYSESESAGLVDRIETWAVRHGYTIYCDWVNHEFYIVPDKGIGAFLRRFSPARKR
jgi:hypothetical protein